MTSSSGQPPAGWYPDPAGSGGERFWDGTGWSQGTRPRPDVETPAIPPVQSRPVLASWWRRVGGSLIDSLVFGVPVGLIANLALGNPYGDLVTYVEQMWQDAMAGATPATSLPADLSAAVNALSIVALIAWAIYRFLMVRFTGGTIGQHAVGVRVVADANPEDTKVSWGMSALRAISAVLLQEVPLVNIADVLAPLLTAKKQTIHDMIAKTVVVRKTGKSDIVHSA